jgi:hypothetical protein
MGNKINVEGFAVSDANVCTASGGFVGDLTGQAIGSGSEYLTDGAIALTDSVVDLDSSGGTVVLTLGSGATGQIIHIGCSTYGNTTTVGFTGVNAGANLVTFTAAGDCCTLACFNNGTNWFITSVNGATIS